jgi:hypothetical protein
MPVSPCVSAFFLAFLLLATDDRVLIAISGNDARRIQGDAQEGHIYVVLSFAIVDDSENSGVDRTDCRANRFNQPCWQGSILRDERCHRQRPNLKPAAPAGYLYTRQRRSASPVGNSVGSKMRGCRNIASRNGGE